LKFSYKEIPALDSLKQQIQTVKTSQVEIPTPTS